MLSTLYTHAPGHGWDDLLEGMLQVDQETRFTTEQILTHPYVNARALVTNVYFSEPVSR